MNGPGAALSTARLRPTLWLFVFTGPALRTSLLGSFLVAQQAIGKSLALSAETLAILVECAIFGGLLAVFLVPPLVAAIGLYRLAATAGAVMTVGLAAAMAAGPFASSGTGVILGVFVVTGLLGFLVAVPAPLSQTLLNSATASDSTVRHSLQSAWSAGQPAGFIVASLAGGPLVERFGWWAALAVPLAFAVLSAVALLDRNMVPPSERGPSGKKPGTSDIIWIVLALVAFETWSTWGSVDSWIAPGVLVALAATCGITAMAVNRARRSSEPVVSPAPFASAGFAAALVILFIYQIPTTAEFEVLLLTQLGSMSADAIGARTAAGNAVQIAGTAVAAALLLRHRVGLALVAGFGFTAIGLAGYVLYPWWDGVIFTTVTRAIAGLGAGILTPVLFVLALNRMPASLQIAAGTWLVLALIGGTEIGIAVLDIVLKLATNVAQSARAGFIAVEIVQFAFGIATALLALWLVWRGSLPLRDGEKPIGGTAARVHQPPL